MARDKMTGKAQKNSATRKPSKPGATKKPAMKGDTLSRPHQQEVMNRLRRVEGQIRGILAMMEDEKPCDAIAQQLAAARKALDRAFYEMMACSLEMEVIDALDEGGNSLSERITEMTRLMAKYA